MPLYTAKLYPSSDCQSTLRGKTLFITGASRGIGLSIALRAAREGANIVIAAKTATPHPNLPGTVFTAAKQVERVGGEALPLIVDVRFEDSVRQAVKKAVDRFGGIDIVVNNASAISLTNTDSTSMKKFDLMHNVNVRGTFLVTKMCLPYLKESAKQGRNPHIIAMSPPLSMNAKWFRSHVAYSMSKFGMSQCILAWAPEFKKFGIAANALWPRTAIATAAVRNKLGGDSTMNKARIPEIMADAAHLIFCQPSDKFTGHFLVDEDILFESGIRDFSQYKVNRNVPDKDLAPDFFVDPKHDDLIYSGLQKSGIFDKHQSNSLNSKL